MKEIFLMLSDHLIKTVPGLVMVDLDRGQLTTSAGIGAIAAPAVYLKINLPIIEEINPADDIITIDITARVVTDMSVGETSSATPGNWRERALAAFDIQSKVTRALRRFDGGGVLTPLVRVSATMEDRSDGLYVAALRFRSHAAEYF